MVHKFIVKHFPMEKMNGFFFFFFLNPTVALYSGEWERKNKENMLFTFPFASIAKEKKDNDRISTTF